MSTKQNKANDRRFFEAVNQGNLSVAVELSDPGIVFHNASTTIQGQEAFKQFIQIYLTAFPDLHFTIEEQIAEGDMTATRYTARGTHRGDLMGIPPSGKQVTTTGIYIVRWSNGKSVESWLNFDALGLLQQLGEVPGPVVKSSSLTPGQFLQSGEYLVSSNRAYFAIMQTDGNFCVYRGSGPSDNHGVVWAINLENANMALYPGSFAIMQTDGNFCVFRGSDPSHNQGLVWAINLLNANMALYPGSFAVMQDDGNFCVYQDSPANQGSAVWRSGSVVQTSPISVGQHS